jgi:hypothetical protein
MRLIYLFFILRILTVRGLYKRRSEENHSNVAIIASLFFFIDWGIIILILLRFVNFDFLPEDFKLIGPMGLVGAIFVSLLAGVRLVIWNMINQRLSRRTKYSLIKKVLRFQFPPVLSITYIIVSFLLFFFMVYLTVYV